jgi:two-component system, NtrC family, nitrogen regulation response regulator GlnG
MADHLLDSPTLNPGGDSTALDDARLFRGVALTILWHPDVSRVGESSVLSGPEVDIGRVVPFFGERSRASSGAPLRDTYLSAHEPSFTVRQVHDRIEILPRNPAAQVKVDGARLHDCLVLPRAELDRGIIITVARRIVLCLHLARPARVAARAAHGLVGVSDATDDLRREIDQVADLDVPVLIRGENGTGKGMLAAALVAASPRAGQPFVSLNMGAIAHSTAASELFGHERGSFTGANVSKLGLFAAADGGTLFLDEIGLLRADVQPSLLDVLETGEVRPLGSTRARKIHVRLIAATDTDLERAIASGTFSEALFQRLARYQITLPPLRHRREDFGVLLVHFLRQAFKKYGEPDRLSSADAPWLSASTVATLAGRAWPGNVRELENVAGQIVVSSRGQAVAVLPGSLAATLSERRPESASSLSSPTARSAGPNAISEQQVAEALARSNGSASRAAKILGVSRTTYYELRKRNPLLRSITEISDQEVIACRDECGGDVAKMAARLGVPVKALKDRLARISPASR